MPISKAAENRFRINSTAGRLLQVVELLGRVKEVDGEETTIGEMISIGGAALQVHSVYKI